MGSQRVRYDLGTEQQQNIAWDILIPKTHSFKIKFNSAPYSNNHWDYFCRHAAAAAKSLQSCLTLYDPIDGSPPGSPVPGIHQARMLEWIAISLSNAWKWKVKVKSLSRVQVFATPWTVAHQAPPSMIFSGREYWSEVPLPSSGEGLTLLNYPVELRMILFDIFWQFSLFVGLRRQ